MPGTVLIVEGNTRATSARMAAFGAQPYAESFAELLKGIAPELACTIVRPADEGPDCLPPGKSFHDYDGIVWTGSALNCYDPIPAVTDQLTMARAAYASGAPIFGSCWGLQVFVTALGGVVRRNPKGREIGFARAIALTPAGAKHPMYAGKGSMFEAFAVHVDEVEQLPAGATVLASNAMSRVQAAIVETDGCSFWGLQYHAEFDFRAMAVVHRRLAGNLVDENIYADEKAVESAARDFEAMPGGEPGLLRRYAVAPHMLDGRHRTLELRNWLCDKVLH